MNPSLSYENIPDELKRLKRWVNFDCVDGKKMPFVSGNCSPASHSNPETWRTFDEAVADVASGKRDHIGFCFAGDGYTFIDLDNPSEPDQAKVLERFDTYAQTSVSGNGIHIIAKGTFSGTGKHPVNPAAGIFQTQRFCLFTGAVLHNRTEIKEVPTEDLQSIHTWLSTSKEYPVTALEEIPSNISDADVYTQGCKRYHRFEALTNGDWQQFFETQSEGDHALISMICDLTPSNEQVRNLFERTGMWNAERQEKKGDLTRYIDRSISQIRSKQVANHKRFAKVNLDFNESEPKQVFGLRDDIDSMPDGLIKRIADWGWGRSEYPLQEAAMTAAFSVIGTVAGRNYQTYTRSGLNTWMILLAGTGTGKNDYQNIIGATVKNVSDANKFGVGFTRMFSGELASGQAMEDMFATRSRCLCYFPEFDDIYQNLVSTNAAPHFRSLKKAILNAYMMSGRDGYLSRRLKARQKNEEVQDEAPILSPLLMLAGECTSEAFYRNLSAQDASTGFLQRFSILEAKNGSASNRPSETAGTPMPEDLIEELLDLFVHCDQLEASGEFITVTPDAESLALLRQYRNDKKDASLSGGINETTKQFYTRAGLKVIRFASQFAVAADFRNPVIRKEHVLWSIAWVDRMDNDVLAHFTTGAIGNGQSKQENEILKVFADFAKMSTAARKKEGMLEKVAENKALMPHIVLKKKVITNAAFMEARESVSAFERCLKHMEDSGQIIKVPMDISEKEYGGIRLWCLC